MPRVAWKCLGNEPLPRVTQKRAYGLALILPRAVNVIPQKISNAARQGWFHNALIVSAIHDFFDGVLNR